MNFKDHNFYNAELLRVSITNHEHKNRQIEALRVSCFPYWQISLQKGVVLNQNYVREEINYEYNNCN